MKGSIKYFTISKFVFILYVINNRALHNQNELTNKVVWLFYEIAWHNVNA